MTLARPLGLGGPGGRDAFGELFQIAVTAAWAKQRAGEPIHHPRAFLRGVIVNQRKMQLRSERRHPASSYDELAATADITGGQALEAIADRRPSVAEQVAQRELAELITHILLSIEPRARTVWTMRFFEGRSPEEAMTALAITRRQYARLYDRANTAINRKLRAVPRRRLVPGVRVEVRAARRRTSDAAPGAGGARASRRLPELPPGVRDVHAPAPGRLSGHSSREIPAPRADRHGRSC